MRLFAVVCLLAAMPGQAIRAQMLGVPVLQNAFANPGITVAANYGDSNESRTAGVAASWAPGLGRLQLSAGGGVLNPEVGSGRPTWGLRGAFSVRSFLRDAAGIGIFTGIGGLSREGVTQLRVPVGASVGYRRALGATRGISAYATPFYLVSRLNGPDTLSREDRVTSAGVFRISGGVDVALMPALGLTVGFESGAEAEAGDPGPVGTVMGIGLSWAFGR